MELADGKPTVDYKFCVIGCQHMHIAVFIEQMLALGYECVGIYDSGESTLTNRLCNRFRIPRLTCLEETLDESIRIVACASPNRQKIDVIEWCERHGKHIMLDKPAVIRRADYERLQAVVKHGRIQIGMLLTERFQPTLRTLKTLIADGVFGELVHITTRKPHRLSPESRPPWFFRKDQHGGIITDLMIHDFDLLRWLTNRSVVDSQGYVSRRFAPEYPSFEDMSCLQVLLEGNVTAQLYADWHTPDASWTWGDGRFFVSGTKGTAEVRMAGDPQMGEGQVLRVVTQNTPLVTVEPEPCPTTITQDFIGRFRGEDAVVDTEDILAANLAAIDADERVIVLQKGW